jgi:hypothetical protein
MQFHIMNIISVRAPLCHGFRFCSLCFRSSAEIVRRRVVAWDTSGKGKRESHLSQELENDKCANLGEQSQATGGVSANTGTLFPRQRVRYIAFRIVLLIH